MREDDIDLCISVVVVIVSDRFLWSKILSIVVSVKLIQWGINFDLLSPPYNIFPGFHRVVFIRSYVEGLLPFLDQHGSC